MLNAPPATVAGLAHAIATVAERLDLTDQVRLAAGVLSTGLPYADIQVNPDYVPDGHREALLRRIVAEVDPTLTVHRDHFDSGRILSSASHKTASGAWIHMNAVLAPGSAEVAPAAAADASPDSDEQDAKETEEAA